MAYIDIGIRYKDGRIAVEALDGHQLRIYKTDTVYGIPLVATTDWGASPIRIYDGSVVKSLAKYPPPIEYNGESDYEPDNANLDYPWDKTTQGTFSIAVENDGDCDNGKRLNIDTPIATADCRAFYYKYDKVGDPWTDYVSNTNGWEIECRLKVIDSATGACQYVAWTDGTRPCQLTIRDDAIYVSGSFISESTQWYYMDTTDAYHEYNIIVKGTSIIVKVDGTQRITGTLDTSASDKDIWFGDISVWSGAGGQVYWDYIKYKLN